MSSKSFELVGWIDWIDDRRTRTTRFSKGRAAAPLRPRCSLPRSLPSSNRSSSSSKPSLDYHHYILNLSLSQTHHPYAYAQRRPLGRLRRPPSLPLQAPPTHSHSTWLLPRLAHQCKPPPQTRILLSRTRQLRRQLVVQSVAALAKSSHTVSTSGRTASLTGSTTLSKRPTPRLPLPGVRQMQRSARILRRRRRRSRPPLRQRGPAYNQTTSRHRRQRGRLHRRSKERRQHQRL